MKKVNLKDILPFDLPLEAVYTLIRIKSKDLRDDKLDESDEDTISRELIDYVESFGKNDLRLEYPLRKLAIENKLPAKVLLHFIDQDYFSSLFYHQTGNLLINTNNKDVIKKLLEKNPDKKEYTDEFGRTTNTVRLQVKLGDYDKAVDEFDKLDMYYGPNSLIDLNMGKQFKSRYTGVINDEVFLLLNDIKNSSFSDSEKKDFVKHIVLADSVRMISIRSLSIVEEVLGEEEFDKFAKFLVVAIGQEEKGVFDYDGGVIIEGYNIYNIRVSGISDYRNSAVQKRYN